MFANGDQDGIRATARTWAGVTAALAIASPHDEYTIVQAVLENLAESYPHSPAAIQEIQVIAAGALTGATYLAGVPLIGTSVAAFTVAEVLNLVVSLDLRSAVASTIQLQSISTLLTEITTSAQPLIAGLNAGAIQAGLGVLSAYQGSTTAQLGLAGKVALLAGQSAAGLVTGNPVLAGLMASNAAAVINLVSSSPNWVAPLIQNAAQWASQEGRDVAQTIVGLSSWLYASAADVAGSTASFTLSIAQQITTAVESLLESAGNTFTDFTNKYFAQAVSWLNALSDSQRRAMILEFATLLTNSPVSFGLATSATVQALDGGLAYGAARAMAAAQDLYVAAGSGANPFANSGFLPSSAPIQNVSMSSKGATALTVYLAEAAPSGGQVVQIALGGTGAGNFTVLDGQGHAITPSASGTYALTIPAGSTSLTWSLVPTAGLTGSGTISVTATLGAPGTTSNYAAEYNALLSYGPTSLTGLLLLVQI